MVGLSAQSKGRRLGISQAPEPGKKPKKAGLGEEMWIELCGRALPAMNIRAGIRTMVSDKPITPEDVDRYLESKFGDDLVAVRKAMRPSARHLSEVVAMTCSSRKPIEKMCHTLDSSNL